MDDAGLAWGVPVDGRTAVVAVAPVAAAALRDLEAAAWQEAGLALSSFVAGVCSATLGTPPMAPPAGVSGVGGVELDPPIERAARAFAEQFSVDVSGVDDDLRSDLASHLGAATGAFVQVLYIVDVMPRAWLLLDRLFGAASPDPEAVVVVPYRDAFDVMLKEIAKLDGLDSITTELIRLRGARQHQCRICKSRRSRSAILAGAGDDTFAAIDVYETSDLPERTKTALRLTDAFIWEPGRVSDELLAEVRAAFTPREAVEIVLDLARNAANKAAVAFAADAAVVTDGVELYEIDDCGDVVAGMAL